MKPCYVAGWGRCERWGVGKLLGLRRGLQAAAVRTGGGQDCEGAEGSMRERRVNGADTAGALGRGQPEPRARLGEQLETGTQSI